MVVNQNLESTWNYEKCIQDIKRYLPLQNPLFSFLHNNIFQAFEDRSFFDGIFEASQLYRGRTLPAGSYYRQQFKKGEITENSLKEGIREYLRAHPDCPVDETGLWAVLMQPIKFRVPLPNPTTLRVTQFWEKRFYFPFSLTLRQWCVPFLQSYLDQGQALIRNPYQKAGMIDYFIDSVSQTPRWLRDSRFRAARRLKRFRNLPLQVRIEKELQRTGYSDDRWQRYVLELLFELKGWSGMINRLAVDPDQNISGSGHYSIEEWILLLLTLENTLHFELSIQHFKRARRISRCRLPGEHPIFQYGLKILNQVDALGIAVQDEARFLKWLAEFGERDRFEIWQKAFEGSFAEKIERALKVGLQQSKKSRSKKINPKAHFMFCIDDREESMRRHLESASAEIVTSGVVGFFGLDMRFQSVHHPKLIRQCPPVVDPKYLAKEKAAKTKTSRPMLSSRVSIGAYAASRTLFKGWAFSLVLGPLSFIPLILRIAFPKKTKAVFDSVLNTRASLGETFIESNYPLSEQAHRVEMICRMAGLTPKQGFPDWVFVVSHGSTTQNNPYRQAYGCGACSGNSGEPNARLFCQFANDRQVRSELIRRGFEIPDQVRFIPSHHDTTSDDFRFDFLGIPENQILEAKQWLKPLDLARRKNAQERLARLLPNQNHSAATALAQVKSRSLDLAQPRPEYGHSSVAMAVFGPRNLTSFLDLNRRSFLVSYDRNEDLDGRILQEVLVGALPVCANIGLDYFFSAADPDRLGSGSKLPLNITSLLGVMTGSKSDLRIGLARQMTEIHSPIRMHIYIDANPMLLKTAILSHPRLKSLVLQEWVHIFQLDSEHERITRFRC